jgi:hypothetical protein
MDTIEKSEEINQHRRSFLGSSVATVAAAQLLLNDSVEAQPSKTRLAGMRAIKPGTNTLFASLKQIDAGLLSVGYAEAGPSDGPVVILLHGWPYDIHSFAISTDGLLSDLHGSSDYRAHLIKVMAQRALAA